MMNEEKVALLEEVLELEEGTLSEEIYLFDVEKWDSIAKITFISFVEEKYGRLVGDGEIKECRKVSDLLHMME